MTYTPPSLGSSGWGDTLNDALADIYADVADSIAGGGANVDTQQDTASTSYTDLSTVGPSVSITLNNAQTVLVHLKATCVNTSTADDVYMSFAASGDTTVAADNARSTRHNGSGTAENSSCVAVVSCNAGTTTFTAKYRVDGGNGRYTNRVIAVEVI